MNEPHDSLPPIECLDLAMLFRRASRLMARAHYSRDHAGHAQEHVLSIVRHRGGISQAELLAILDVRSASLSELLTKLEKAGRIVRKRNPEDRRGFVISPLAGSAEPGEQPPGDGPDDAMRESAATLFGVLNPKERQQLWNLLNKLIAPLQDMETGPHGSRRGFDKRHGGRHGRNGGPGRRRHEKPE
ncbi:winged helix-turn-helix transcriptional regulator [Desulfovibrio sulfodismutans]|uniref:Winged helix-turn-helix transcriptional regulator n=1 Tax=Desulfolutivibrio sulfodismutans TaxID=63561 RepID=A0A7K3NQC4_9BACT|nr:MarR family winged helix-turn-helix transcriptional regulator [Desulfolutivibrio sulfodismutans]NDY58410.1 winged helix-turn-helix transcriptional regulator [Desulfolutivibrio sulfodismutans]QLA13976.1 MarR family transcriptional regulator [Desulfolutivibrio sulfodismutans DSM 3696]